MEISKRFRGRHIQNQRFDLAVDVFDSNDESDSEEQKLETKQKEHKGILNPISPIA